jgi:aryl sulfotransferase
VLTLHFSDMKRDLPGAIRRIAAFLEIAVDEAAFPNIVRHCSFDYMKAHAEQVAPLGGVLWQGGARTFVNKGTNGRWRDTLTADEIAAYEAKALAELGSDCAWWLAMGEGADG